MTATAGGKARIAPAAITDKTARQLRPLSLCAAVADNESNLFMGFIFPDPRDPFLNVLD
jgi:hypothetical protein